MAIDESDPVELANDRVFPYLSASTQQGRWERAVAGSAGAGLGVFAGADQSQVHIRAIAPDGASIDVDFTR